MTSEPNSIDSFLDDFRHTIHSAKVRLLGMSSEQSRREITPGNWSAQEVIGHLIDSASNNHQRFVRAQFTNDLVFPGYEQDKWVESQRYNDETWTDLVQLWALYNRHIAHLISVMPEETLTKARLRHNLDQLAWQTVDKGEPTTLEYFIRDYVGHLKHHLGQIFK
jgi:hypothetical protein